MFKLLTHTITDESLRMRMDPGEILMFKEEVENIIRSEISSRNKEERITEDVNKLQFLERYAQGLDDFKLFLSMAATEEVENTHDYFDQMKRKMDPHMKFQYWMKKLTT